jgi:hypothetical protein
MIPDYWPRLWSMHLAWEKGILPDAGGMRDQPAWFGRVMPAIACGLDVPGTKEELDRWGYARSLEGVAAHLQQIRKQLRLEAGPQDAEMLRYSTSRKWL